jgi:hypothetical protein
VRVGIGRRAGFSVSSLFRLSSTRLRAPTSSSTGATSAVQYTVALLQQTLLDNEAQRLVDEQRIAIGVTVHQFGKRPRNQLLRGFRQHPPDLLRGQSAQMDPRRVRQPVQLAQRR